MRTRKFLAVVSISFHLVDAGPVTVTTKIDHALCITKLRVVTNKEINEVQFVVIS